MGGDSREVSPLGVSSDNGAVDNGAAGRASRISERRELLHQDIDAWRTQCSQAMPRLAADLVEPAERYEIVCEGRRSSLLEARGEVKEQVLVHEDVPRERSGGPGDADRPRPAVVCVAGHCALYFQHERHVGHPMNPTLGLGHASLCRLTARTSKRAQSQRVQYRYR